LLALLQHWLLSLSLQVSPLALFHFSQADYQRLGDYSEQEASQPLY
jgi:hypothetical protein